MPPRLHDRFLYKEEIFVKPQMMKCLCGSILRCLPPGVTVSGHNAVYSGKEKSKMVVNRQIDDCHWLADC
jgi:hypothetical protein